jgi:ABC-2 type transport system permease protein
MIRNLKLHLKFISMKFTARMAYRFDFFASMITFMFFQLISAIVIFSVYNSGGKYPGWGFYEMLLLTGIFSLIEGFSYMAFFGILWNTQSRVREGRLETILIKPVNSLWLLVMDSFDEEDIGQFIGGIIITTVALIHLTSIQGSSPLFILFVILGLFFFFGVALLCSAAAIKFTQTGRLYEIVSIFMEFASYPKTVYSRGLGIALSTILPMLVISFYPASILLGKPTDMLLIVAICVLLFVAMAIAIWYKTLKSYSGSGG